MRSGELAWGKVGYGNGGVKWDKVRWVVCDGVGWGGGGGGGCSQVRWGNLICVSWRGDNIGKDISIWSIIYSGVG